MDENRRIKILKMNKLQRIKSFIKETSNYFISITSLTLAVFAVLIFIILAIFGICSMIYDVIKMVI
jgi:hypothetical protein